MRTALLRRLESRLAAGLEWVLAATLLGILIVVVVLVVLRYGFDSGLVGANESATMAFVYVSSLGAAVAVGRDEHVRVDLLSSRFGSRGRDRLAAVGALLVGLLNIALLLSSITWIADTGHIPMPVTQVPRAIMQVSIPIGCGLAALFCLIRLITLWNRVLDR